jgi:hypothetical protein
MIQFNMPLRRPARPDRDRQDVPAAQGVAVTCAIAASSSLSWRGRTTRATSRPSRRKTSVGQSFTPKLRPLALAVLDPLVVDVGELAAHPLDQRPRALTDAAPARAELDHRRAAHRIDVLAGQLVRHSLA